MSFTIASLEVADGFPRSTWRRLAKRGWHEEDIRAKMTARILPANWAGEYAVVFACFDIDD